MRHLLPYLLSLTICFISPKASSSTTTTPNTEKTFVIFYADLTLQHPDTKHLNKKNYFNKTIQTTQSCILPSATNIQKACTHFLQQDHPVIYAKFYVMDAQGTKKIIAWNKETTTEKFPFKIKEDLKGLNVSFEQYIKNEAQQNSKANADKMLKDDLAFIFKHIQTSKKKHLLKGQKRKCYYQVRKQLHEEIKQVSSLDNYLNQLSTKLQEALSSLNQKERPFNWLPKEKKSQKEQIKKVLTHIIVPMNDNNKKKVSLQYDKFKKQYRSLKQATPMPFLLNKAQLNFFFQQTPKLSQNIQELAKTRNKDLLYTYTYLTAQENENGAIMNEEMNTSRSLQALGIQLDTKREKSPISTTPMYEESPSINTSSIESLTTKETASTTPSILQGITIGVMGSIAAAKSKLAMSTKRKRKKSKKA